MNASDDFAALMAEAVGEGILWIGRDGRIQMANASFRGLLGVSPALPDALLGQTPLEATHLSGIDMLCRGALGGVAGKEEVRLIGRHERLVQVRALPLSASAGGGALLLFTDLTELRRLQTVRTEFVANVSHELRTPLASIRATAETLLDGAVADPEYAPRFLETIIKETDRLVRLSEDLLQLSRAETAPPERTTFELGTLVTEVVGRLMSHAARQDITLTLVAPPLPLYVHADYNGMDQVFFNLIENAIKYTPTGGSVKVTAEPVADKSNGDTSKGEARVTVRDTGIGILAADLPRIFERFWRADRARKFQGGVGGSGGSGGTGLGLSIVKHIVESHGGRVSVQSDLGRGSRFTVHLPLVEREEREGSGETG